VGDDGAIDAFDILPVANLSGGGGIFMPEDLMTELFPAFSEGKETTWWGFVQLTLKWP